MLMVSGHSMVGNNMITALVLLQLVLLAFQVYCLVKGIKCGDMFSVHYGFALWGAIPNTLIALVVRIIGG